MEKSKIVNIQQYKLNNTYYNIGVVVGALRASLESGEAELVKVYDLLPQVIQNVIAGELLYTGGTR